MLLMEFDLLEDYRDDIIFNYCPSKQKAMKSFAVSQVRQFYAAMTPPALDELTSEELIVQFCEELDITIDLNTTIRRVWVDLISRAKAEKYKGRPKGGKNKGRDVSNIIGVKRGPYKKKK